MIGIKLGWGNPFVAPVSPGTGRANTTSLGLRAAGSLSADAGKRNAEEAVLDVITA